MNRPLAPFIRLGHETFYCSVYFVRSTVQWQQPAVVKRVHTYTHTHNSLFVLEFVYKQLEFNSITGCFLNRLCLSYVFNCWHRTRRPFQKDYTGANNIIILLLLLVTDNMVNYAEHISGNECLLLQFHCSVSRQFFVNKINKSSS